MLRFYENLLGKRPGMRTAMKRIDALTEAKTWLRRLNRQVAEKLVTRLAGGVLRGTIDPPLPEANGKRGKLPMGKRPFEHPYYWAAFILVGDPH